VTSSSDRPSGHAAEDGGSPIYLDYNATTPVHPEVLEAMLPFLRVDFGNPSSLHAYGRRAHEAIDRARVQVATLIACQPGDVLFTSGGTEANNLAVRGALEAIEGRRHVVTSLVEHPAIEQQCAWLERHGFEVDRVPVDVTGRVLVDELRAMLGPDTAVVSVMLANNETGTVMPIAEIAEAAHVRGAVVHSDAAQAVGKIQVNVDKLGVDLLTLAGHKMYAPKGTGALYVRPGTPLQPLLLGGGHERGLRPGTEDVAAIVGLGRACAIASDDLEREAARVRALRDTLWALLNAGVPGMELNGHLTERLPNTLNVSFPNVSGSALLAAAPELAASTGSACHEGGEPSSPVLVAMGLDSARATGAIRLSLGRGTTEPQVRRAAQALIRAYRALTQEEATLEREVEDPGRARS
jgi:cysteine desulfurase